MPRTPVEEIDFFAKENAVRSACSVGDESFRFAGGIDLPPNSRINPFLLPGAISSSIAAAAAAITVERPIPPPASWILPPLPSFPGFDPNSRSGDSACPATAPMTIIYKGTVAVFDLKKEKAEELIKLAEQSKAVCGDGGPDGPQGEVATSNKQPLPIARKKSLQRFLEKRKERLTTSSDLYK